VDLIVFEVEADEVRRALDQHQRCQDCRPSTLLVVTRDDGGDLDWRIIDAHNPSCPARQRGRDVR
jgi:hypothetical protein